MYRTVDDTVVLWTPGKVQVVVAFWRAMGVEPGGGRPYKVSDGL